MPEKAYELLYFNFMRVPKKVNTHAQSKTKFNVLLSFSTLIISYFTKKVNTFWAKK